MDRVSLRVVRSGLLGLVVTVGVCAPAAVAVAVAHDRTRQAESPHVATSSGQKAERRLDSRLIDSARSGGSSLIDVMVRMKQGVRPPRQLVHPVPLHLAQSAADVYVGRVKANLLEKLATGAGVRFVSDNRQVEPPGIPDVPSLRVAGRASAAAVAATIAEATRAGAVRAWAQSFDARGRAVAGLTPQAEATPGPTGWYDVGPTHRSAEAWALGYTGQGVLVGVADTGVDFAHPDLSGTQAIVTDRRSPYAGWPMAYDPYSLLLYAIDAWWGTTYVADGDSWFSDTRATVKADAAGKAVFGGTTYVLPAVSASGTFHMGYLHDENLVYLFGFPEKGVPILVSDEKVAGSYDTVRVDLNGNEDFSDDKPCTKESPISYLDYWDSSKQAIGSDGYADLSGGMVYWIADGANQPPGYDVQFSGATRPGSGDLVCFMGSLDYFADHGTLCASNVVGQGVIDGASIWGEHPTFKGPDTGGMVQGGGKDVGLVAIGNVYSSGSAFTMAYDFAARGLDGVAGSGDELQSLSCSFGYSWMDNDEWDYESRYITKLNTTIATSTAYVFAAGNGGPGYGTNAPPSPTTGISVGASTQFGADGGWDSIVGTDQVTAGDVIPFSNRGPSAMGNMGVNVVADGAYAAGSLPLNELVAIFGDHTDGWRSWEIWAGTSRSAPVTAGNLALVQQAFKARNGRWPTWAEARLLLQNGARDLAYDPFVQGAGMVDAARSVKLAAGLGGLTISPYEWAAGSFRGTRPQGFTHLMSPGATDSTSVRVTNTGSSTVTATLRDVWHQRAWTKTLTVTLDPDRESYTDFNRPDVLIDLAGLLPAGVATDLLVVRAAYPLTEMDPGGAMAPWTEDENLIRLLAYDWKDIDADGRLWTDTDGNGFVAPGELDAGEYERFTYSSSRGTTHEIRVQRPQARMHNGIYLGLQHSWRDGGGSVHVTLEVSGWNRVDWPWLTLSATSLSLTARAAKTVTARLTVPANAPLGAYEGQILVRDPVSGEAAVPVTVNVAGTGSRIVFGGDSPYVTLLDSGSVAGLYNWSWRGEAGDWRFIFTDVPNSEPLSSLTRWLVRTSWETTPTDLDTLIYGPQARSPYWPSGPESFFGPYDLAFTGGSTNTNVSSGRWGFQTATGGAAEVVTAPLAAGLNQVMLHNVLASGAAVRTRFQGSTGKVSCLPGVLALRSGSTSGTARIQLSTSVSLSGLVARAAGLAQPKSFSGAVATGQWWFQEFTVGNSLSLEVRTVLADNDIDLYVERLVDGEWVTLGGSLSVSGNETVHVDDPVPGLYRAAVYGYSVAGTPPFQLIVDAGEGTGLAITSVPGGTIAADTTATVEVAWTLPAGGSYADGDTYTGTVVIGVVGAARVLEVPVTLVVDRTPPQPPQGLAAVPGSRSVTLSWRNLGDDYELTRMLRSTTGYAVGPDDATGQTRVCSAAASSITDANLSGGTVYYYTAFNRDVAGNWSTAAKATARPVDTITLGQPTVNPSRPRRSQRFTITGTISPAHAAATTVTLFITRKSGSSYVAAQQLTVSVAAGATTYSAGTSLSTTGTYRVSAYHADEQHAGQYSAYREFTVR